MIDSGQFGPARVVGDVGTSAAAADSGSSASDREWRPVFGGYFSPRAGIVSVA